MCECAWQQPCATANPGFRPQITNTLSLKKMNRPARCVHGCVRGCVRACDIDGGCKRAWRGASWVVCGSRVPRPRLLSLRSPLTALYVEPFCRKNSRKTAEPRVHREGTDLLLREGPCNQGASWGVCGSGAPSYDFLNLYDIFNNKFPTSFS